MNVQEGKTSWMHLDCACLEACVPVVQLLLEKGANPNAKDDEIGRMALFEAASNGHVATVESLASGQRSQLLNH